MSETEVAGMVVPYERLSEEALSGLITEFILRDGTDYGLHEIALDIKSEQIFSQLKSGKICVVFDPVDETCSIVSAESRKKV